jgi:ABC-type transport system substrate-binding protein
MSQKRYARWALAIVAAMFVAACGGAPAAEQPAAEPTAVTIPTQASVIEAPTAAPAPAEEAGSMVGEFNGIQLPADAAPSDQQVYRAYFDSTATFTSLDFMVTVYEGGGAIRDMTGEPLIRLDNNFRPQPAAALSWSSNADGTEWTFKLDPNLKWSDGTSVTAADYVNTFQYAADKDHAWDFAWFFGAPGEIKNWSKVNAGEVPNSDLGVVALDDLTVVFTTETPAPFFPAKALYSMPLQKAAFDK